MRPPKLKPADGSRLQALLFRVCLLQKCQVKFQPDHVDALERVVDFLLFDQRQAEAKANSDRGGPPEGFGKLD